MSLLWIWVTQTAIKTVLRTCSVFIKICLIWNLSLFFFLLGYRIGYVIRLEKRTECGNWSSKLWWKFNRKLLQNHVIHLLHFCMCCCLLLQKEPVGSSSLVRKLSIGQAHSDVANTDNYICTQIAGDACHYLDRHIPPLL